MDKEQLARALIKPLVWHNFDVWTWWAECPSGTYHVEERNAGWRVQLRVGGLAHDVLETDDTTPADLEAAKAAAEADYLARMSAALDLDAVAALVGAANGLLFAHDHGQGLEGWHNTRERLRSALAKLTGELK